MHTVPEIEDGMACIALEHAAKYEAVKKEYHRLLEIMGNVDGDEIILLLMVAQENCRMIK